MAWMGGAARGHLMSPRSGVRRRRVNAHTPVKTSIGAAVEPEARGVVAKGGSTAGEGEAARPVGVNGNGAREVGDTKGTVGDGSKAAERAHKASGKVTRREDASRGHGRIMGSCTEKAATAPIFYVLSVRREPLLRGVTRNSHER